MNRRTVNTSLLPADTAPFASAERSGHNTSASRMLNTIKLYHMFQFAKKMSINFSIALRAEECYGVILRSVDRFCLTDIIDLARKKWCDDKHCGQRLSCFSERWPDNQCPTKHTLNNRRGNNNFIIAIKRTNSAVIATLQQSHEGLPKSILLSQDIHWFEGRIQFYNLQLS